MRMLQESGAIVVAVAVCLDRQEIAPDYNMHSNSSASSSTISSSSSSSSSISENIGNTQKQSAIQQVEAEFGVPVISIIRLNQLIAYVEKKINTVNEDEEFGDREVGKHHQEREKGGGKSSFTQDFISEIKAYRKKYGSE